MPQADIRSLDCCAEGRRPCARRQDGIRLLGKGEPKAKASFVAGVSRARARRSVAPEASRSSRRGSRRFAAAKKGKTRDAKLAAKAKKKA
jgi:hypothetical protein